MSDSQVVELEPQDESLPEAAVEQAPAEPEARPQGPPCAHCGVPGDGTTWCRSCGWVPHLKTFVAVDQEAEAAAVSDQPQSSELRFSDIVPPWAWVLVGSVLGVLAVSVLGKLLTPAYSVPRVFWVVGQLLIGLLVFGVAHFRSYLQAITDNAQLAVTDVFIKPLAVWLPTLRALPATLKRTVCGVVGLTAAICAPLVVGGVPWHEIWELGPRGKPKQNLVQAITQQAAKAKGDSKTLDEAVKGFAGEGGEGMDVAAKQPPKDNLKSIDCVVIGYKPLGDGDFAELLLVSLVDEKLKIVGGVSEGVAPEQRVELNQKLRRIERPTPFVDNSLSGYVWVEPMVACRVKFEEWSTMRRLVRPIFAEILAELK